MSPTLAPPSPSGTINSALSSSSDTVGACTRTLGAATAAGEPGLEEEALPPASEDEAQSHYHDARIIRWIDAVGALVFSEVDRPPACAQDVSVGERKSAGPAKALLRH